MNLTAYSGKHYMNITFARIDEIVKDCAFDFGHLTAIIWFSCSQQAWESFFAARRRNMTVHRNLLDEPTPFMLSSNMYVSGKCRQPVPADWRIRSKNTVHARKIYPAQTFHYNHTGRSKQCDILTSNNMMQQTVQQHASQWYACTTKRKQRSRSSAIWWARIWKERIWSGFPNAPIHSDLSHRQSVLTARIF